MTDDDDPLSARHGAPANTQKALARKLGLSASTISLALRDDPRVAVETRERVRAAMREAGYVPDATASALRTGKTGIVGLSLHDIGNHYFADMVMAIEEALAATGRALLINYHADRRESLANFIETLISYKADGLILSPSSTISADMLAPLRARGVPVVYVGRHLPEDKTSDRIIVADREAFVMATQRLIDLGHRDIVMLGGSTGSTVSEARAEGLFAALRNAGLSAAGDRWIRGGSHFVAGVETMTAALARTPRPTGYVCYNDLVAFGAMATANGKGVRPGFDAGFVGFGDTREGAACFPSLTSVRVGPTPLGARASELLVARLLAPKAPPRAEIVKTDLVIRRSCGPPRTT